MPDLTRHAYHGQIRSPDESGRFEAVVLAYDIVDDYDTVFDPGCFTESLQRRLPRITWSHDWSEPIGRWVDYKDTRESLTLIGELDDFDAVPRARQAYAQLKSGTIDQFSVGFRVNEDRKVDDRIHFVRADLDEAALVLVGAVPGTKLVSVRSGTQGSREVPLETLVSLAKKIDAGDLTPEQGQAALTLASGVYLEPPVTPTVTITEPELLPDAVADIDAAEAALESLGLDDRSMYRGAKPVHSTGTEDSPWDGNAAMTACTSGADYWAICAWRDSNGDPANRSSYKFPHHKKPGGPANLAGVRNALSRLPQANIPSGDVAGVRRHLQAHLESASED